MDDWENWEEAAEKDVKEIKVDNKFADEEVEAVDIDAKDETKIKTQPKNAEKNAKKEKASQLAKKWEEKEKQYDTVISGDKKGPLTAEERKKAQMLSEASDAKNTVDLFGGFIEQTETQNLKTEQAFVDYAKKIADILAQEDRKKYIQEFMKELLQQIYPKLTSLEYEQIHTKCQILFNQKQKEEKGGPAAKKKAQPKLNAAKGSNAAKLMDFDDDEEEEYVPRGRNDLYDDFM